MSEPAASNEEADSFSQLAEPFRHQLHVHCYRMLGSLQEAEDVVQETYLRAWRARDQYEGRTSFRNWLYRIATNACLSTIAARSSARRLMPEHLAPPSLRLPSGELPTDIAWLEPYPDAMLHLVADQQPGPDARYEMRESIQLAFVAAIQHLPPRQRAVLLLRDVLGWSARDAAELLQTTTVSVNSALQRARATLETRLPPDAPERTTLAGPREQELLREYVRAWEAADIERLVALLTDDVVFSMPPWPMWFSGHGALRHFLGWVFRAHDPGRVRLVQTGANGQPAFVQYLRASADAPHIAHGVQVLTLARGSVAGISVFLQPEVLTAFDVPPNLD